MSRSHGGIGDSRLDRESACGRMMIRSSVNGESQLKRLLDTLQAQRIYVEHVRLGMVEAALCGCAAPFP